MNSKLDTGTIRVVLKMKTRKMKHPSHNIFGKTKININQNNEIVQPEIKWQILKRCSTYKSGNPACDLCTSEQIMIIKNSRNPSNINHRSDLGNKSVNVKREMLSNVT